MREDYGRSKSIRGSACSAPSTIATTGWSSSNEMAERRRPSKVVK